MPSPFRFKKFSIDDSHCGMKVGMDAVLLGAWTEVKDAKKIIDIGTGTGILAIMLAQKSNANIDAVEIDKDAYEQAKINISNSDWQNRINAYHSSIQDFSNFSEHKYELIVSNPPYFINSFKAPAIKRQMARHSDQLSQTDLIQASIRLLEREGRLSIILPFNEGTDFRILAEKNKLFCNRLTFLRPKKDKSPHRMLMDFSFNDTFLIEKELIIEETQRHHYTEEYKELTKDYYLAF